LIQYTIAEAQIIMKIQLIVLAANQDDNSMNKSLVERIKYLQISIESFEKCFHNV
jgi:hypothetical protein